MILLEPLHAQHALFKDDFAAARSEVEPETGKHATHATFSPGRCGNEAARRRIVGALTGLWTGYVSSAERAATWS